MYKCCCSKKWIYFSSLHILISRILRMKRKMKEGRTKEGRNGRRREGKRRDGRANGHYFVFADRTENAFEMSLNALFNLNNIYYSFKIFPRFWLAKSTRIIHHNQLLMTKFGRILCLTRKWRQKCSLLQVNAPLTEKTWGRGWVVLVEKTKYGGYFTRFKSKKWAKL